MKWSVQLTNEPVVQRSLDGERVSEGEDKTGSEARDSREAEGSDLFEDRTEPLASADDSDYDTTTWVGSAGPPILIDESTGPVPLRPDASGATSDLESDPPPDAEEAAAEEATALAVVEAAYEPGLKPSTDIRETIPPSSNLRPMLLERIEPSLGRGERLRLDAAHWRVQLGRADENDVRLYTASASRFHAEIAGNEAGEWVLTPEPGRSVKVDGDPASEPIILEVGMNLVMGGDHLRCVTEGPARDDVAARTTADAFEEAALRSDPLGIAWSWRLIGGIALVGAVLSGFAWFMG